MNKESAKKIAIALYITIVVLTLVNIWAFVPGQKYVQIGSGWNQQDGNYPVYEKSTVTADVFPHVQLWLSIAVLLLLAVLFSIFAGVVTW